MSPDLLPTEPLSQVVFVHDYIQLVFQDACFSIYNIAELRRGDTSVLQGQPGFCDGLVGLIGLPLISVSARPILSLTFQGGVTLVVTEVCSGPEAWQYNSPGCPIVVEQNA
jgi:hypothetical protein